MNRIALSLMIFCSIIYGLLGGEQKFYKVEVDEVFHGQMVIEPPIPENGLLKEGSVLKITATPESGYSLDSIYQSYRSPINWMEYDEKMSSPYEIVVNKDISVGASFIKSSKLEGFKVIHNVVYAKPGKKILKYDVYTPDRAKDLPCIVIIHGGGWTHNNEDVMRGLARELVRSGEYVVCSVDYRWRGKRDGDEELNSTVDLIEDVYGAIAHIQEHAKDYGADATRLAVTGDSAGGHLSASVANMANRIGERGFEEMPNVYEYKPSYMPEGKTVMQVRKEILTAIKAAAPSYGVYGGKMLENHAKKNNHSVEYGKAISPIYAVPEVSKRWLPQFILRGTKDRLIKHEAVMTYVDELKAKGQYVAYIQVEGAHHPFLDWRPNPKIKATFYKHAVPNIEKMKHFFDGVFYKQ